jgi:outer membrane receptor protein involved in Fe transport
LVRKTQTNSDGIYIFSSMPLGTYDVQVSAQGFGHATFRLDLIAGAKLKHDFVLTVGNATTVVDVSATGDIELESTSHSVGMDIDSQELTSLPTNGRNPLSVALLAPASESASDAAQNTSSGQSFGTTTSQLNLGGGMDSQTSYLQDGVQNLTLLTQSANLLPSVDAIQQMSVITNGASARYAQPSVVNIITRGGSNHFHGTAFDFLQNDSLNAQNYNLTGIAQTKQPIRYNQFGGTAGGPLLRNRAFIFGSYSGLRQRTTAYTTTRVPTDAERLGDFSEGSITLYDPLTYSSAGTNKSFLTTTGKNAIPTARISPFATTLLGYIPKSNLSLNTSLNINYQVPLTSTVTNNQFLGRIDFTLSSRDQLYLAGGFSKTPTVTPSFMTTLYGAINEQRAANAFLEETHQFTSNIVNTLRAGYNRSILFNTVMGAGSRAYYQEFGLKNLSPLPAQWAPPTVAITSYFTGGNRYAPQGATQNRFQYADEVNYQIGKHSLFFGGEFIRIQFDGNWTIQNNGYYTFNSTMTAAYVAGSRKASGSGFADVLLGYPSNAAGATGTSIGSFREWQVDGYLQDDWQIMPQLTLNLGIRYDFDNPPNDRNGKSSIYNLPSNEMISGTWHTNYRDVSPRIGIAYALGKETAIHGGYGIHYASSPYNYLQFLLAHAPNFITQTRSFTQKAPVAVTDVFSATPSATGITPQTLASKMPDVYVEQFNLFIDHKFSANYSLTAGYAGQVGKHSSVRVNANQPVSKSATSAIYDIRPYSYAGDVFGQYNIGSSNSNGLQAKFLGRLPGGSRVIASYTWSKSMNISDGDRNTIENYNQPNLYYAPAAWDRPQHLNIGAIYRLPFGRGQRFLSAEPLAVDAILGGWQINAIYRYATGLPVSVTATNTADSSSIGTFMAQKTCDPNKGFTRSKAEWFNTACFVQPGNGVYGVGGRNSVRQPPLNLLDLGLNKSLRVLGDQALQIRIESFNALNHPQFQLPGSISVSSTSLGAISGMAKSMRVAQVALRYSF